MEGHKEAYEDLDFTAKRVKDKIAFTISGEEIYTRCYLNFADVIQLHTFLKAEIEQWLVEE